ncbi:MAG: hypothetical protein PHF89_05165 [Eubacteriales bacterium]|nr:hypothetical protein [Eubacteriales bacterium]
MKRILSAVLLIVMLFSTAISAKQQTDTSLLGMEYAAFFKAFPLFQIQKQDGEVLTRAEFAQVVVDVLSYRSSDFQFDTDNIAIVDLEEAGNYANAAVALVRMGYMQGSKVGAGAFQFRPSDAVTSTEMIKVWVEVLGYGEYAKAKGGYPIGYMSVAHTLGIRDESIANAGGATVADGKRLTFKALHAEVAKSSVSSGGLNLTNTKGETFLSERLGIVYDEGVLKANPLLHITGQSPTSADSVLIDDTVYKSANLYENATYIGRYVRFYIDTKGELKQDGEIVCMYPIERRGMAYVLSAGELQSEGVLESLKNLEDDSLYSIDKNAGVYYNFEYLGPVRALIPSDSAVQEVLSLLGSKTSADVYLADNNGDDMADFVWIRSYENIILKSFIYDSFKFAGTFGESIEMHTAFEKGKVFFYDEKGETFHPKDFDTNDVISLIYSVDESGECQLALGFVSKSSIRGMITEIAGDEIRIQDEYYVLTNEYKQKLDAHHQKAVKIDIGVESLFYLNAFGMIAGANVSETVLGEKTIAFLYKVAGGKGLSDNLSALLYGIDGERKIINLSNSVRINGKMHKGKGVLAEINKFAQIPGDKNAVVYRMVQYQQDDKGIFDLEIYAYQTKENEHSGGNFERYYEQHLYPQIFINSSEPSAATVYKASTFGKRVGVSTDAIIMAIPSVNSNVDLADLEDDAFYPIKISDLDTDSVLGSPQYPSTAYSGGIAANPMQMAFYDVDATLFSKMAVRYYEYVGQGGSVSNPQLLDDCIIVENIVRGINENSENVLVIYGMQKGVPVRAQTISISEAENPWNLFPALKYQLRDQNGVTTSAASVMPGDAIQVLKNSKGEIINILVLMRAANKDEAAWLIPTAPSNSGLSNLNQGQGNQYLGVNYGSIVEYEDGKLVLDELDGVRRVYLLGNTTITAYNRVTGKVSKADIGDLEIGKDIFIRQYYSGIKEVVYYID